MILDDILAHVPDPQILDSFIDLLTLCNIGILHHVLDFNTYSHTSKKPQDELSPEEQQVLYKYDCNAVTLFDRQAAVYTRYLALDIIDWLDTQYTVKGAEGETWTASAIARHYLAMQCSALVTYKERAEAKMLEGATNCTAKMIQRQIEATFPLAEDRMRQVIQVAIRKETESMCFPETIGDNGTKTSTLKIVPKNQGTEKRQGKC